MKKGLLFRTIAILALMISFTSCSKDEVITKNTTEESSSSRTAEVTGKVTASDLKDAKDNFVPDGTKIKFLISKKELYSNPDLKGFEENFTTVKGGQYKISLKVPFDKEAVTYKIMPVNFDAEAKQDKAGELTHFEGNESSVGVKANQNYVQDLSYKAGSKKQK